MNKFLFVAALVNVASAVNIVVTTICNSASYTTGTLNPLLTDAYSSATAAGSTARVIFASADPRSLLQPTLFASYEAAFLSFQSAMSSVTTLSNGDISEAMTVESQLATVLYAMANSYGPLMNLHGFVNLIDTLTVSVGAENAAINSLIQAGGVACEEQNSLYSVGLALGSSLSVISAKVWYISYMTTSVAFTGVSSKSCTADCTTLTMIGADTTSSTTSSTSTSTSNGEITSSRTVSGTVERCLVRATSTTSSTTVAPV